MQLHNIFLSSGSLIDLDGTFVIEFVLFWIAFFVLKTMVFKPILATLDAREEAVEGARREARKLEQEAIETEESFEAELRKVRAAQGAERDAMRTEAKALEASLLEKVRQETMATLAKADADLANEVARAEQEMAEKTPALAKALASRLLERELT